SRPATTGRLSPTRGSATSRDRARQLSMRHRRKGARVKQQSKSKSARPSRRKIVKGMFAAAVASSMGKSLAQTTKSSTTQADEVSIDDIAAADRVAGRSYSEAERKLMAKSLSRTRQRIVRIRKLAIDPNIEPAVRFDPRLADTKIPTGESECRLSD